MNNHRRRGDEGLHPALTGIVVLVLLALLAYSVVRFGVEGYPLTMFLGGLLGAYAGLDRAVRRKQRDDEPDALPPSPPSTTPPPEAGSP